MAFAAFAAWKGHEIGVAQGDAYRRQRHKTPRLKVNFGHHALPKGHAQTIAGQIDQQAGTADLKALGVRSRPQTRLLEPTLPCGIGPEAWPPVGVQKVSLRHGGYAFGADFGVAVQIGRAAQRQNLVLQKTQNGQVGVG